MAQPRSYRQVALDPTTSNLTGVPWLIADMRQLSISIETQVNTASRYTVIGSNDDGLQSTLATPTSQLVPSTGWSILTTILQAGVYTFDPAPGFRWLNVFRPSASSATVTYVGRT